MIGSELRLVLTEFASGGRAVISNSLMLLLFARL